MADQQGEPTSASFMGWSNLLSPPASFMEAALAGRMLEYGPQLPPALADAPDSYLLLTAPVSQFDAIRKGRRYEITRTFNPYWTRVVEKQYEHLVIQSGGRRGMEMRHVVFPYRGYALKHEPSSCNDGQAVEVYAFHLVAPTSATQSASQHLVSDGPAL